MASNKLKNEKLKLDNSGLNFGSYGIILIHSFTLLLNRKIFVNIINYQNIYVSCNKTHKFINHVVKRLSMIDS